MSHIQESIEKAHDVTRAAIQPEAPSPGSRGVRNEIERQVAAWTGRK